MGQHKYNPKAEAAKNGDLPPKKKPMSKRKVEALMRKKIQDATSIPDMVREMGAEYIYV